MTPSWFDRAIEAIDLANSDCPDVVVEAGAARPKEVVHSERMTDWVIRLAADPTPAQLLAARAHHLRRWVIARRDFPEGRSGYLRWREAQKRRQGDDLRDLLDRAGCPPDVAEDAAIIVAKATRGDRSPQPARSTRMLCALCSSNCNSMSLRSVWAMSMPSRCWRERWQR